MQHYSPERFVRIDSPQWGHEQEKTDPADLQQVLVFLAELQRLAMTEPAVREIWLSQGLSVQ